MRNNGDAIKDVRLAFTNSSMRMKEANEMKLGDLAANGEADASAVVFADLAPVLNLVSAKVTWVEKDVKKEQALNVPVTITSDADVSVYLEAKPTPLTAGKEHTLSVLVSNIGSYGIDNVDVAFHSDALTALDLSPSQYIGSLEQDDFSTVQFKVKPGVLLAGNYDAFVNVTYRDKSGEWRTKTIKKAIAIYGAQQGDGSGFFVLALAALAVGAVWYFKFRKPAIKK